MAAKRGTKGDYICHVPKGGTRHGCGAGNKVVEIDKRLRHIEKKLEKALGIKPKAVAEPKAPHPNSWVHKAKKTAKAKK